MRYNMRLATMALIIYNIMKHFSCVRNTQPYKNRHNAEFSGDAICQLYLLFPSRFVKTKNPNGLVPMVPLSFIGAYYFDLAYGSKLHRMRGIRVPFHLLRLFYIFKCTAVHGIGMIIHNAVQ